MPFTTYQTTIRIFFYIGSLPAVIKEKLLKILSARNNGLIPVSLKYHPEGQISSDGKHFCAFSETSDVFCISVSWEPVKLSIPSATSNKCSNFTAFCSKKAGFSKNCRTSWFYFMVAHQCTGSFSSRAFSTHWKVGCYSTTEISRGFASTDYHRASSTGHTLTN